MKDFIRQRIREQMIDGQNMNIGTETTCNKMSVATYAEGIQLIIAAIGTPEQNPKMWQRIAKPLNNWKQENSSIGQEVKSGGMSGILWLMNQILGGQPFNQLFVNKVQIFNNVTLKRLYYMEQQNFFSRNDNYSVKILTDMFITNDKQIWFIEHCETHEWLSENLDNQLTIDPLKAKQFKKQIDALMYIISKRMGEKFIVTEHEFI